MFTKEINPSNQIKNKMAAKNLNKSDIYSSQKWVINNYRHILLYLTQNSHIKKKWGSGKIVNLPEIPQLVLMSKESNQGLLTPINNVGIASRIWPTLSVQVIIY